MASVLLVTFNRTIRPTFSDPLVVGNARQNAMPRAQNRMTLPDTNGTPMVPSLMSTKVRTYLSPSSLYPIHCRHSRPFLRIIRKPSHTVISQTTAMTMQPLTVPHEHSRPLLKDSTIASQKSSWAKAMLVVVQAEGVLNAHGLQETGYSSWIGS
jgi:hypothetical protein